MARPRGQRGQVKHHGNNWIFLYYVNGDRKHIVLAPFSAYPFRNPEQVREKFLDKINGVLRGANASVPGSAVMDGMLTVEKYIEQVYWPHCKQRLQLEGAHHMEPSTIHGYESLCGKHVLGKPIASIPINQVTSKDCQDWLNSIPQNLNHKTHLRVRAFLSGVLTCALQGNAIAGVNPMDATKAGGATRRRTNLTKREQKIAAANDHAYTHEEVAFMLEKFPEPLRTMVAVAAFTGLTKSEIPALKWSDYHDGELHVRRKKWNSHIGAPKTEAREAGVPVAPFLQQILEKYRANKEFPPVDGDWMFYGSKEKKPIHMDNLTRREVPMYVNGAWFGWHAFRRGLGTRLNDMGMDAVTIQSVLRHANIATTLGFYVFPNADKARAGLKKLTETVKRKYGIKV